MTTEIVKIENLSKSSDDIKRAGDIIKRGGLVVFPTETVYGLGADATNPCAAQKIYAAKGRPSDNPLIIHIASPKDADRYAYTNDLYFKLAKEFMPGPLTVILKAKEIVPEQVRAGLPTVAVRCPSSDIARALIAEAGVAVAAPSANLSGSPSPTRAAHVIEDMFGRVDMIIDGGDCQIGVESTIVQITEEGNLLLLRPGKITPGQLEKISQVDISDAVTGALKEGERPQSPGMKYRHYAPKTEFILLDGQPESVISYLSDRKDNFSLFCYRENYSFFSSVFGRDRVFIIGSESDEEEQAHNLFSMLRYVDKKGFEKIYAPLPSKSGVGLALYNRMIRAAAHKIIRL